MTNEQLVAKLREFAGWTVLSRIAPELTEAADRLEALARSEADLAKRACTYARYVDLKAYADYLDNPLPPPIGGRAEVADRLAAFDSASSEPAQVVSGFSQNRAPDAPLARDVCAYCLQEVDPHDRRALVSGGKTPSGDVWYRAYHPECARREKMERGR